MSHARFRLRLDGAVTHASFYFSLCLDRGRQTCRLLYYTPARVFTFFITSTVELVNYTMCLFLY
ncbi:uncharacterized protein LOC108871602 [Brassica rapa]|uniref:uncharacterized protein LOC108871602 n=1 Tax=Brassica campestris TaxID=3711 RepID=UPI00142D5639|nr:uncharacterized protein LOC108871602 [Brassica rapa]